MASKAKKRGNDLKQEEILQAVVIADSFNVRFGPATALKPRALLPLVGVPMLEHTLNYLALEGIQEVIVFACHLGDQIRDYIRKCEWDQGKTPMVVKVVLTDGCRSLGDALREIDSRQLLRSDFFLLGCDTIANVDLKKLMKEHKARREQIRSCVMTMTHMRVKPQHRLRCVEDNVLLVSEQGSGRIWHYQKTSLARKIKMPMELFTHQPNIQVHQDLSDSQLYVCSPQVLHLFTDNFDYGSIEDFVKGILINEEILGNTIHITVFDRQYCARVSNPYMYNIISQDIIANRSHPINPCSALGEVFNKVFIQRPNLYQTEGVHVSSGVIMSESVVICKGTSIQSGSRISHTVIGQNCKIGSNVKLEQCYIWDDVTIEDNCVVKNAIICGGVTVFANTTVQHRTILSWNVKVGPNIVLPANLRLQDTPQKNEFGDSDSEEEREEEEQEIPDVTPQYGLKSRAFPFATDETYSDDEEVEFFCTDWGDQLRPRRSANDNDQDLDDENDEDEEPAVAAVVAVSDLEDEDMEDDFGQFYSEMMDTLKRAKTEKISVENLILEVNSLKHAYNIAIRDVHQAVVKVLVDVPIQENESAQGRALVNMVLKHIEGNKGLLKHYIKGLEAQRDCLLSLEDFAVESDRVLSILSQLVHHLYNCDLLDEQVITAWYNASPDEEDEVEEHGRVRKQMEAFITWLNEAEEESDD